MLCQNQTHDSGTEQQTLTGGLADEVALAHAGGLSTPDGGYILYCPSCGEHVLRTDAQQHEHLLFRPRTGRTSSFPGGGRNE